MWNAIETTVDYLHFSVVADTVAELIEESNGNPISIGVSGNWGVGKSSMVKMIGAALQKNDAVNAENEKNYSLNVQISKIKSCNKEHNFGIIYPSIGGSNWDRLPVITPSYLFSDYILSAYTRIEETHDGTRKIDVKAIFCFDKVSDEALIYLCDMINELQLESRSDRKQEVHIYFYPETQDEIDYIKECFARLVSKEKPSYELRLLDNRRLSRVSYE